MPRKQQQHLRAAAPASLLHEQEGAARVAPVVARAAVQQQRHPPAPVAAHAVTEVAARRGRNEPVRLDQHRSQAQPAEPAAAPLSQPAHRPRAARQLKKDEFHGHAPGYALVAPHAPPV